MISHQTKSSILNDGLINKNDKIIEHQIKDNFKSNTYDLDLSELEKKDNILKNHIKILQDTIKNLKKENNVKIYQKEDIISNENMFPLKENMKNDNCNNLKFSFNQNNFHSSSQVKDNTNTFMKDDEFEYRHEKYDKTEKTEKNNRNDNKYLNNNNRIERNEIDFNYLERNDRIDNNKNNKFEKYSTSDINNNKENYNINSNYDFDYKLKYENISKQSYGSLELNKYIQKDQEMGTNLNNQLPSYSTFVNKNNKQESKFKEQRLESEDVDLKVNLLDKTKKQLEEYFNISKCNILNKVNQKEVNDYENEDSFDENLKNELVHKNKIKENESKPKISFNDNNNENENWNTKSKQLNDSLIYHDVINNRIEKNINDTKTTNKDNKLISLEYKDEKIKNRKVSQSKESKRQLYKEKERDNSIGSNYASSNKIKNKSIKKNIKERKEKEKEKEKALSIETIQNEEIRKMKNEMRMLKEENKKLKVELKNEKNKNEKFRKIAEEMISFYETSDKSDKSTNLKSMKETKGNNVSSNSLYNGRRKN